MSSNRSSSRRILGALLSLGLLVTATLLAWTLSRSAGEDAWRVRFEACRTNDCVVEVLLEGLAELGPAEVLATYRGTRPDSGGQIDCHDATHRLGEKAFAELGQNAWVPGGNVCNFGFYHGFMVGASASASLQEFEGLAHRLCEQQALPEEDLPGPECVHGFGHAVFHLTGSLAGAVERCAVFGDDLYRRRCNEGAVKDGLMVKPDVTEADFTACGGLDVRDQGTCVYVTAAYAVVRAASLGDVATVCAARTGDELLRECEEGLGRGVSMRAVGERFPTPGVWALEVCGDSAACAFGFGRSVFFIRNDLEWSRRQCEGFDDPRKDRCRAGVDAAPGAL